MAAATSPKRVPSAAGTIWQASAAAGESVDGQHTTSRSEQALTQQHTQCADDDELWIEGGDDQCKAATEPFPGALDCGEGASVIGARGFDDITDRAAD